MSQQISAKSAALFFARLRSAGNAQVAAALKCSEPTVSQLSGLDKYTFNFNTMPELLARLGLKIVPDENKCYKPEEIENLLYWAKRGMDAVTADSLEWEED